MALSPLSLSSSRPRRRRPVPVSFAARGGALRSDRVASRGAVARPLSSAPATLWQWGTPVAREIATEVVARIGIPTHDTRQVTGHTAIITLHSPLHPPCSARSRPGTVGVICVTDCCECPLCRADFFFDVYSNRTGNGNARRGAPPPGARPAAPAPTPADAGAGGARDAWTGRTGRAKRPRKRRPPGRRDTSHVGIRLLTIPGAGRTHPATGRTGVH